MIPGFKFVSSFFLQILCPILAVEAFVNFFKMTVGDVGVNLRCVDRGVAEELLDRADVGAVV